MRIHVRVQTRAGQDLVGGRYGDGEPPILVVRVRAAPHAGQANAACRKVLAEAFGVPRQAVAMVAGAKSKSKVFEVTGADPNTVQTLLEASG